MTIHSTPAFGSAAQPQPGEAQPFTARWRPDNPRTLVVACADGRFTQPVMAFAQRHLRLDDFDCLFIPGGPGSLSDDGAQFLRAAQMRREVRFLMDLHETETVFLIWHGPGPDGPEEALCGHYAAAFAGRTAAEISALQRAHAEDLTRGFFAGRKLDVRCYRAEVGATRNVRFVEMP
jgi:hypothetical protein